MPFYPSYQPYYQPYQQPQQQSSLIHVQTEQQAREWSVAPGCSVMFIDDNAPYIYTKSAGSSQLEPSIFKKFKVSEIGQEAPQNQAPAPGGVDIPEYVERAEFEAFLSEFEAIKSIVKELTADESA